MARTDAAFVASEARFVTRDLLMARRGDLVVFFVAAFFVVAAFFGMALAADLDADLDADLAAPEEEALFTGSACAAVLSRRALGITSAPVSRRTASERSDRGLRAGWADFPKAGDTNFLFMRLRPFQ